MHCFQKHLKMEEKKFSFCSSIRSSYKLSSQLKKLGAQVGFVVNSETDFVVCSTEEFEKGVSYKIKCAKKYNVCIVEEQVTKKPKFNHFIVFIIFIFFIFVQTKFIHLIIIIFISSLF